MIRVALAVGLLSAVTSLPLSASAAPTGDHAIRVAQADVTIKETVPEKKVIIKKPSTAVVVKKRSVTTGTSCRTVTTHVREGGRTVVKKVKRCD
jgi:hypothetical protein